MKIWLESSLNCIQISKLEMKISAANVLSWPAPVLHRLTECSPMDQAHVKLE